MKHFRMPLGKRFGMNVEVVFWDVIRQNSFVVVTASEALPGGTVEIPLRVAGAAQFMVSSIAPVDGAVFFCLEISHYVLAGDANWVGSVRAPWPEPLETWVDVTVF